MDNLHKQCYCAKCHEYMNLPYGGENEEWYHKWCLPEITLETWYF